LLAEVLGFIGLKKTLTPKIEFLFVTSIYNNYI
jgi:hypothetical protein